MRVLMLTHNTRGRGSFFRAHALARSLARMGHEVTILAASQDRRITAREESLSGVLVAEMPGLAPHRVRNGGLSPLDVAARLRYVLGRSFDIVHGFDHRPAASFPALAYRRRHDVPYLTDWADLWGFDGIADERPRLTRAILGAADHVWERWTRRAADGVTAINGHLKALALELGVPDAKLMVLPAGADVEGISPIPKAPTRRKHGMPEDGLIAVHSGFAPYDQRLLGEAFVELAAREPRAWLLTLGGRLPVFERIVKRTGVSHRVIRVGFRPYAEYAELLACGDVMLLPYSNRGVNLGRSPNRMGDYMAAGRPTVTNPTGDLGQMVREERVGLVADETPGSFAEAIQRLFLDPELRDEVGMRARRVAEQRFAWRILARDLEAFYRELLSA